MKKVYQLWSALLSLTPTNKTDQLHLVAFLKTRSCILVTINDFFIYFSNNGISRQIQISQKQGKGALFVDIPELSIT